MKYKRESRRTWRSSAEFDTESDVNDHEPLLSDASVGSRRSFGTTLMFPDASETSDFESTRHIPLASSSWPSAGCSRTNANNRAALDSTEGDRLSRFQYYSTIRNFVKKESEYPSMHSVASSVFIPYVAGPEGGKQNSLVTVFAIWNTVMGSSLLAMPWGMEKAGFLTGLCALAIMAGVCYYLAILLLRVDQIHNTGNLDWEVPELAGYLLGPVFKLIAQMFSIVVLFGAAVVYWILLSNFLYHSVGYIHDDIAGVQFEKNATSHSALVCRPENLGQQLDEHGHLMLKDRLEGENPTFLALWNLHTTVPVFLTLIIFPLINFKSVTFFTKFNSFGTMSVIYLLIFIAVKATTWGFNSNFSDESNLHYARNYRSTFPALTGMLSLSLFIHNIVLTIMRNNKVQENNRRDLTFAFGLITTTYAFIGGIFYLTFPLQKTCIQDNYLNNFQNWDVMTVIARFFLFFQLTTVYPLLTYMLRVQIFTTFRKKAYPGVLQVIGLNCGLVFCCILFAIFLPRIGTIIRFTGASTGCFYMFTLPVVLYLVSLKQRDQLDKTTIFLHTFIPILGFSNLLAQFFI